MSGPPRGAPIAVPRPPRRESWFQAFWRLYSDGIEVFGLFGGVIGGGLGITWLAMNEPVILCRIFVGLVAMVPLVLTVGLVFFARGVNKARRNV